MQSPEPDLMGETMHLCWVIACTRCHTDRAIDRPDDLRVAVSHLQEEGWTARKEPHPYKSTLAPHMDVSAYPDEITVVLCPVCSGLHRG